MEKDRVTVTVQGKTISVNRECLAEKMNKWNQIAKHLEKRPGERIGTFYPNEHLSADTLAVLTTIFDEYR